MANLSSVDRKILETLLGMGGGYLLDFSNVTYAEFFNDYGIDIYHQRYQVFGNSKAKLMRGFWQVASDEQVGKILEGLFRYITETNPDNCGGKVEDKHRAIGNRLLQRQVNKSEAKEYSEEDFLDIEFKNMGLQ